MPEFLKELLKILVCCTLLGVTLDEDERSKNSEE